MAEHHRFLVAITVDTEAERDVNWPQGTQVFCKDTEKNYQLVNGVFKETGGDITTHINQSEIHRNIDYNSACGFVEITI